MRGWIALVSLLCSLSVGASILPPNNLHLEDDMNKDANINEELFNQIVDDFIELYRPIVEAHGATLVGNRNWRDSTVNAFAQQSGSNWIISMFGGLARRDEVTPDGFALVVCHELGHHLAGFPFKGERWAASEGQSDYFATQSCGRKAWAGDLEINAGFRDTVHPTAKARCDEVWSTTEDQNLCYRIAMAGHSLASLLAALGGRTVDFDRPDLREVPRTVTSHPQGQCRLDTYFAGAVCGKEFNQSLIPGRSHPNGQGSVEAEQIAAEVSCTRAGFQALGTRPLCWYKPQVETLMSIASFRTEEVSGNGNGHIESGETFDLWVEIENLAERSFENVRAVISSIGDKFTVVQGEATFGQIGSQATSGQDVPFQIQIGDMECGESFDFKVDLALGEGSARFQKTLRVGHLIQAEPAGSNVQIAIPDNNREGIVSPATVTDTGIYSEVTVTVDITHTYIGDLKVMLISPAGQEFMIHDREGGSADNIQKTMTLDLGSSSAAGEWKMAVQDWAGADLGTLNSWNAVFAKAVCE